MMVSNLLKSEMARKAKRGQGVIEYAGALVISTVLVAAVLAVGPNQITTLFSSILGSVQSYFTGQLPGA
jgi:hypothetical protein